MLQDDRYYSFLLTHSSRSKIYIRRIEVSKKLVQSTAASLILTVGLASAGIFALVNSNRQVLAKTPFQNEMAVSFAPKTETEIPVTNPVVENQSINYDRPDSADKMLNNAGGPRDSNLTAEENNSQNPEITAQLRIIEGAVPPQNIPSIWAHEGKINNEFGFRRNPFGGRAYEFHAGMDIDGEKGDSVLAPGNGVVIKAGWQGGYGNMIEVDHGNGLTTRYGHLSKIEVQVGEQVLRGQTIGLVGSTGRSTGPHLHYEVRVNDKAINPRRFLPPENPEIKKAE